MSSFIDSLLGCIWPTEQSYSQLSQFESRESRQSLASSNMHFPTGLLSQMHLKAVGNGHPRKSGDVVLHLASDTNDSGKEAFEVDLEGGWVAVLNITTINIIRLMRERLYVSQENVKLHKSYITCGNNSAGQEQLVYRHYSLTHPKWSGKLVVRSKDANILSAFRLEHMSADRVFQASATAKIDNEKRIVYWYNSSLTGPKINVLLNDEPLLRLWPWPRPKKELRDPKKIEESSEVVEARSRKSQDVEVD
ncbi:hypothetical protein FLAG1_08965 [Fusarium langsethiae]|uniref:Uncharacterized protein n=1 Tax=Fusarium langsethiae TaxID=179993 RepID=A0A0N1J2H2_FUSLA|nr:hypothetical protein FLAG1_08965 [Fusarium langsethiae]GKU02329.1 unnamed protein product [Fusarium langsethiae]GKU22000.1 unnamed protein product [Fusarium langsethiae]